INDFARGYPQLMSLRSVDLSPASRMAVAWYPIYHIPSGRTIKDLSACFLTYHTLSLSFQDGVAGGGILILEGVELSFTGDVKGEPGGDNGLVIFFL
ncbi:hypothetical protein KI387_021318, partial [Taxus chinensis]